VQVTASSPKEGSTDSAPLPAKKDGRSKPVPGSASSGKMKCTDLALVSAAKADDALVVQELSDTLGEDGRLLRMFVVRGEHLKADAREQATKSWLIRASFYDEYLDQFIERYERLFKASMDVDDKRMAMVAACKRVLAVNREVEKIEHRVQTAQGDVHQLRDALLAAVKELSVPRRMLGRGQGNSMTEETKTLLQNKEQIRLRNIVFTCLQGIWTSGVGGDILKLATAVVQKRIERFESRMQHGDDVSSAMAGAQWLKLKELVTAIDSELESKGDPIRKKFSPKEGKGTHFAIMTALQGLGGAGTTADVIGWLEKNPAVQEQCDVKEQSPAFKLNENKSTRKAPIWHNSVRSALAKECKGLFTKVKPASGSYVYKIEGSNCDREAPLPITDGEASKVGEVRKAAGPPEESGPGTEAAAKRRLKKPRKQNEAPEEDKK